MDNELNNEQKFIKIESPKISYFKAPITRTKPYTNITLADVYMVLTGHWHKTITERLRQIIDLEENRIFKSKNFPFVTFSGTFSRRRENGLIQHSNLITIDFDKIENVEKLKNQLLRDKYFETSKSFNHSVYCSQSS